MKISTQDNKGIHITHKNGLRFSIQFGAGNYCSNKNGDILNQYKNKPDTSSYDCEVAVIDPDGNFITNIYFPENGKHVDGSVDVYGYCPIEIALHRALTLDIPSTDKDHQ